MTDRLVLELETLWNIGNQQLPAIAGNTDGARQAVAATAGVADPAFADPMFSPALDRWNILRDNFVTVLAASVERTRTAGDAVKSVAYDFAATDQGLGEELNAEIPGFAEARGVGPAIGTGG